VRRFLARQAVLPFESLIAFLVVVSGSLALLHVGGLGADALSLRLPALLNTAVQALYVVSGLAVWLGLGLVRRDIEAFGLVTLSAGVLIRSIGLFAFVGIEPVVLTAYLFNAAIILTCAVRFLVLVKGQTVVLVKAVSEVLDEPV